MSSGHPGPSKQVWPWPDSLDAVMAAPNHHTVLFENESVRVLETRILPGQIVPVHTHRWPSVLFNVTWSDFVRRDQLRNVTLDTRQSLETHQLISPTWLEPLPPHTVENVGDREIRNLQVEIKSGP
jgi:hypothetical protein